MKIFQLSHSVMNGGANRAAYRAHHAFRREGVDSPFFVKNSKGGDWTVENRLKAKGLDLHRVWRQLGRLPFRLLRTSNAAIHAAPILPSRWPNMVNSDDVHVVYLHWIAEEMFSIADVGGIRKPVVWTSLDMWPFCGAEHYSEDFRWPDLHEQLI